MSLWLFLHLLGFTMWLGGGWRRCSSASEPAEDAAALALVVRMLRHAPMPHAPGLVLTVVSGLPHVPRLRG